MSNRKEAVRRRLRQHGLRVNCVACGHQSRWFAEKSALGHTDSEGGTIFLRGTRLRDVPCPECGRQSMRSTHWIERHPELAREAGHRARQLGYAMGRD